MPSPDLPSPLIPTTHHFIERAAQRRLHPAVLQFILAFATELRVCGANHLTIVERELPEAVRNTELARRARGWIVLQADDGSLLTCYRRQDAWRFLRRKTKRKLSNAQLWTARERRASYRHEIHGRTEDAR